MHPNSLRVPRRLSDAQCLAPILEDERFIDHARTSIGASIAPIAPFLGRRSPRYWPRPPRAPRYDYRHTIASIRK
jgi:hypothetical protein